MRTSMTIGTCFVCAMLCLGTPSSLAAEVRNDNVVILLDASGSMASNMGRTREVKMDAAKAALREVLKQVPETTNVGLLVFSGRNISDPWVYPLGPRDDQKLIAAINRPIPGGGTPLGKHLKIAADRLLEERKKQFGYGSYRLLVVTDGEAQDGELVDRYTPEIMARGITVDVIGVDMAGNHTLAQKVHSYRKADDPESLKRAIADVFAEVSSTGDDSVATDTFEVIEPIPFETATAMLTALGASGNDPIAQDKSQPAKAAKGRKAQQAQQTGSQPAPRPMQAQKGWSLSSRGWVILVVAIVAIISASRGRKRRR